MRSTYRWMIISRCRICESRILNLELSVNKMLPAILTVLGNRVLCQCGITIQTPGHLLQDCPNISAIWQWTWAGRADLKTKPTYYRIAQTFLLSDNRPGQEEQAWKSSCGDLWMNLPVLQPTYYRIAQTSLLSDNRPGQKEQTWKPSCGLVWGSLDKLAHTPAHILQDCPGFSAVWQQTRPGRAGLKTKLWGSLDELSRTPAHILQDCPDFSAVWQQTWPWSRPENQAVGISGWTCQDSSPHTAWLPKLLCPTADLTTKLSGSLDELARKQKIPLRG
jgi:hypothetical protein